MKLRTAVALLAAIMILNLFPIAVSEAAGSAVPDYGQPESWVYCQAGPIPSAADVFFICPTVFAGSGMQLNMPIDDTGARQDFASAVNMLIGIYSQDCRVFAPYYRQMSFHAYAMPEQKRQARLGMAYSDIKAAFLYYLENYNDGRPIIIAGFSQGADMCLRLIKDVFADEELQDRLIACYAIGWRVTDGDIAAYPHMKMAACEDDTGVIISFNTEAVYVDSSIVIPEGMHTLSINPLNWRTDSQPAGRDLNLGACFPDGDGNIILEIPGLTGAYIDPVRGALKVTDISPADYPVNNPLFSSGIYHTYDCRFFYRNLQHNVQVRTQAYLETLYHRGEPYENGPCHVYIR